jgi:hypothetical protein
MRTVRIGLSVALLAAALLVTGADFAAADGGDIPKCNCKYVVSGDVGVQKDNDCKVITCIANSEEMN